MKKFFVGIAQTIVAAAIVGTFTILWNFNGRLSRIESRLGVVAVATTNNNQ